jgi:hypothetical protein
MNRLTSSLFLILFGTLAFGQPAAIDPAHATHLKVHADSAARENLMLSGRRLARNTRTHVILQFDQPRTAEVLAALEARGAVVLQDVPDNAVLVSMNGAVSLDDLGITFAARLDPSEKISPLITGGEASASSGFYLVEFHPDVDLSAARRLILNLGLDLRENPDLAAHHLMVNIAGAGQARKDLQALAAEDAVAYIFPASDDLRTGRRAVPYAGALSVLGPLGQYVATNGDGWDGPGLNAVTLNYVFSQVTSKLPTGAPQSEILRAMAEWSKVIQLNWQTGSAAAGTHTVNILFAQGAHGDGYPFDGAGNVLAHTFYPAPPNPEPIAGDMHFDDSETWGIGNNVDVFSVALHELGHALGLGHSDNPNAVMYPYYRMVSTLADDDKNAILTLYAAQTGIAPPPPPAPGPLSLTVNVPPATTTASTISLSGTVSGGSGPAVLTWSSSTAWGTASVSGTNWTAPSIPLTMGINSITVSAADASGSLSRTVTVTRQTATPPPPPPGGTDTTGPTLKIVTPSTTSFSTTLASLNFTGSASDPSGVASVTWSTNTGGAGMASGTTQWNAAIPLLVGSNQVIIRATDTVGNVSWRSVTVTRR